MKIRYKIFAAGMVLSVFILLVLGFSFYQIASEAIDQRVFEQLDSIAALKQHMLLTYIQDKIKDLKVIAQDPFFYENIIMHMAKIREGDLFELELHAKEREKLISNLILWDYFTEFFIVDPDGLVHLSTSEQQEGKIKSDEPYFINGMRESYVQFYFYDNSLRAFSTVIAVPIKDKHGSVLGVLAGRLNLTQISDIMYTREGLGETGETLLVNSLNTLVSEIRFAPQAAFKKHIYTESVKRCLLGESSSSIFQDYRGVEVLGSWRWMPDLGLCLIAKIDREEARQSMDEIIFLLCLITIICLVAALFVSLSLSKKFSAPIRSLADGTAQIASGNFTHRIKIFSKDEIGDLARSFNSMAGKLFSFRKDVEQHQTLLTEEVEKKTKELAEKLKDTDDARMALMNMMDDVDEANRLLREEAVKRTELFNVTSHELRTPLVPINGYIDLFLRGRYGVLNKEQKSSLRIVKRNIDRLSNLITDVLDIARLQAGKMKFSLIRINPKEIISESVKAMVPFAKEKKLNLTYKVSRIPSLLFDRSRMIQVLTNLINNSLKFSKPSGKIEVVGYRRGKDVIIEVVDDGIGIPDKDIEKIFEKFYQVDQGVSRKYGGTGLGLPISRGIIEAHGGKLWAESKFGKGTKMIISIPVRQNVVPSSEIKILNK